MRKTNDLRTFLPFQILFVRLLLLSIVMILIIWTVSRQSVERLLAGWRSATTSHDVLVSVSGSEMNGMSRRATGWPKRRRGGLNFVLRVAFWLGAGVVPDFERFGQTELTEDKFLIYKENYDSGTGVSSPIF